MYKFRHTIELDDYSGASIEILVDKNNYLSVRAVDLIGDAWVEFLEAVKNAEEFQDQGRLHCTNREIQTALAKLVTHLDGVVSGMCKCLRQRLTDFSPPAYGKWKDCTLAEKISYIHSYVRDVRRVDLRPLDLRFKVLRDLLIHPYANKHLAAGGNRHQKIGQVDLFDVDIATLKAAGSMVNEWLGVVTTIFDYPRGYRTQKLLEEFVPELLTEYMKNGGQQPKEIKVTSYWL